MIRLILCGIAVFGILRTAAQDSSDSYSQLSYEGLDSLANIFAEKGAYDKVITLLQSAREKVRKEFGERDTLFADYTDKLGESYRAVGNYGAALKLFKQGNAVYKNILGEEHPSFTGSLSNLAGIYARQGDYEKALSIFKRALRINQKILGESHPEVALLLSNIGSLHYFMGNYEKALPFFTQALHINRKVLGEKHLDFALLLNNLAELHRKIGNYKKALPLLKQAVAIKREVLGENSISLAQSLNNLALIHEALKDYEKALSLHQHALRIYKKRLPPKHPELASMLNNLALVHQKMKKPEKALPLYLKAKEIMSATLGSQHPSYGRLLTNLARTYKALGKEEKAWKLLGQAIQNISDTLIQQEIDKNWLATLKAVNYPSSQHIEVMLEVLHFIYTLLEEEASSNFIKKQILVTDLAAALLEQARNQVTNEQDKLGMLEKSSFWLSKSLSALASTQQSAKAFELSDQNKSVLLLQATQSEEAYRLGNLPDSLLQHDKALRKQKSQLQAHLLQNRSAAQEDSLRNLLIRINQDIDDFLQGVERNYPKYHQLKYQQIGSKTTEIQVLLDPKTALLEYVITDSILHIFKIDKTEIVWHSVPLSSKVLRKKIAAFHANMSSYVQMNQQQQQSYESYTELAYWFYQQLLQPVLAEADGIENLVIVSDGELGHLPFEAFLTKPANETSNYQSLPYLLRDYSLSYSYSAILWKDSKAAKARSNNGQLLALAANYRQTADKQTQAQQPPAIRSLREGLQPLPAARQEVEALAQRYKGFFAFDSLATERLLREKAVDYSIIHLATHGILDEKRPILSSLALTENNDTLYDNFWRAHEISKMELNADLVVLSACQTGYGRFETGNGIASLARSFMYAGAPSLVVSLWQVSDVSTSRLLQLFYDKLHQGLDKAQALRQAKLQYISNVESPQAAHPAFWSPFILMGDTAAVELIEKGTGNELWYGVGALLLFGLGALFWWNRKRA